jgi:hypothetical protein
MRSMAGEYPGPGSGVFISLSKLAVSDSWLYRIYCELAPSGGFNESGQRRSVPDSTQPGALGHGEIEG